MEVGLRVVRGPDWKWDNQDDGEGHVGTVVEIGKLGSLSTPDKTVVVQWDSGSRTNYRVGYQGACDLRIFDNAATGVRHNNIICSSCKKHGIAGMRWKCLVCSNYDMCTNCYMNGKHDLNHTFLRFETCHSPGIEMPKRSLKNTVKIQAKGIFVGAHVVRGYDWDWGNQDGGENKVGKVIDIRGWDNESRRSVANVIWSSGSTNVYRLGHKGKVDLKYVVDAPGGYYYRDHLPVLGRNYSCDQTLNSCKKEENVRGAIASSYSSGVSSSCSFNAGDKVKVIAADEEELKMMQEEHGGWNSRMVQFIGQIGTVHRTTNKGDIRVQFENCRNRWTFNPEALTKVTFCEVGDIVRIIDDETKARDLQKNHGEWVEQMRKALGKIGKVVQVYTDGDLRVNVDGQTWTFNSFCVIRLPGSMLDINNTMVHNQQQREEIRNPRLGHFLFEGQGQSAEPNNQKICSSSLSSQMMVFQIGKGSIVREAAQGKLAMVKEILERAPNAVHCKSNGKTALQVSCHQGHLDIVKLLLSYNAEIDLQDDEGDTALHYATFGNQPDIVDLLAKKGANLDSINQAKCTPLHIAVNKGHLECVKVLIRNGCNVNLQDSDGDTTLHDAIGKCISKSAPSNTKSSNVPTVLTSPSPISGPSSSLPSTASSSESLNQEIIDLLINAPRSDFTIKNTRGFNCLHHAALKGNSFACERLIAKSRQLVDIKKEDGFSALHLAALNGHYEVAEILIISGQANVNICNNRKQTPLHLAVSRSHCSIIKLLVSMGANCNSLDEELDTPLHLAMFKWNIIENVDNLSNNSIISDFLIQLEPIVGQKQLINLAICCYLIQEGNADIMLKNRDGRSVIDLLESNQSDNSIDTSRVKEFVLNLVDSKVKSDLSGDLDKPTESTGMASTDSSYLCRIGDNIPIDVINDLECIICNENFADVQFEPCRHQICCNDCCFKMKRCVICKKTISRKVLFNRINGQILNIIDNMMAVNIKKEKSSKSMQEKVLTDLSSQDNTSERLKYLESKIMEIEEANSCGICLEKVKNVVFLCGHGACVNCANTLKNCHMCRKTITKKIPIY